tara:strand:- start:92 stop:277 length:186 start_codon:yes stop_codon:yes gene_type:complete
MTVFLVYGRTGWIGGKIGKILTEQGHKWAYGDKKLREAFPDVLDIRESIIKHVMLKAKSVE